MLFPYTYVTHSIEKLQEYIDYLVLEVWCKASGDFDIDKIGHADLKEIVLAIYYDNKITKDHLYGPIETIFNIFKTFNAATKQNFAEGYRINNNIEDLCKGVNACKPMLYYHIKGVNAVLEKELNAFFKNLFTDVIKLKVVINKIGEIDGHYDDFVSVNVVGKCPFCGINDIKGIYHTKREAYDHYLPKDVYAFNAINFKNLAPMCHECNSSYKGVKDPLHRKSDGKRRKAFFPFDTTRPVNPTFTISLTNNNIAGLQPDEIDLKITATDCDEEIESWLEVFGIEERYKGRIIEQYGKYWFYTQLRDEYENYPDAVKNIYTRGDKLINMIESAETAPYIDLNFLKAAFLRECQKICI